MCVKYSMIDEVLWLYRVYGMFDLDSGLSVIEALLAHLNSKNCSRHEKMWCMRLVTAILRQLLALYPLNGRVLRWYIKASSLTSEEYYDDEWINQIKKLAVVKEPRWEQEKNKIYSRCGDNLEQIEMVLKETSNPVALYDGILKFWKEGRWDLCITPIMKLLKTPYVPFVGALLGFGAISAGDVDLAKALARTAIPSFLKSNLLAEILIREGRAQEAYKYWEDSLRREPLQFWIYHRLWEIKQCSPAMDLLNGKKIVILLYTFNKLDRLVQTLSSVLRSHIGQSHIIVMNNGSTAFSKEEFELAVRGIVGSRHIKIVHLPINVGAPAARNWLWHLPDLQDADYVAFLDDDVAVPENWLLYYLQDMELFPYIVAVGAKVCNPGSARTIQYVYRFFSEIGDKKIRFTPTAPFMLDLGQYSYRRPCLSVMGCCHLFNRKRWNDLKIPDFDISFSPSQVDDLEHDIQIWKRGGTVFYDGRVEVVHLQEAGSAFTRNPSDWAHVWGNHMKMETKFSADELYDINKSVHEKDSEFFRVICESVSKSPMEVK